MFRQHVSQHLSAYCQDELAPPAARRVAEHLLGCQRCRGVYEEIKLGVALARELPAQPAPAALWQGIAAALAQQERAGETTEAHAPRRTFALFATWPRVAALSFASLIIA
ncbi:MAG TPA: zf-HC2 domain-containing protein, partial [Pyrinomonadaceae bacterium]|nr:zf-HC2 domain-containing protein [Pyrinomonadaceae bacterium]